MMKRRLVMLWICILACKLSPAQGEAGSFFNQGAEQQKIYLKQIAALQTFLVQLKNGYAAVKKGTGLIHGFKNGEFGLHKAYFASLYLVNPRIMADKRVSGILRYQRDIDRLFKSTLHAMDVSEQYGREETRYVRSVYHNLLRYCVGDMDELSVVITPGHAQMTDAERLSHLQRIHRSMEDKYRFACFFTQAVKAMGGQRNNREKELERTKDLYGLD